MSLLRIAALSFSLSLYADDAILGLNKLFFFIILNWSDFCQNHFLPSFVLMVNVKERGEKIVNIM